MEVLDVLIAARAEVEKGWCKEPRDEDGNVCALFALARAVGVNACSHPACSPAHCALAEELIKTTGMGSVTIFNDAPSTTKADVLALFDRAINAEAQKLAPVSDPAHTFTTAA